jgi:hypothetical protein
MDSMKTKEWKKPTLTEIPEGSSTREKAEFILKGGTLLKPGIDENGDPIIKEKRSPLDDWQTRLTFKTPEVRDSAIDFLVDRHPDKFQKDE